MVWLKVISLRIIIVISESDSKYYFFASLGDDSGWIKGKTCYGLDYGFVVNDVTRKRNPEIALKDLATAKKDCAEACNKNVGKALAYYNQTCKYASLLFEPDTQMCYLSSSEWCNDKFDDALNFYLYTKQWDDIYDRQILISIQLFNFSNLIIHEY